MHIYIPADADVPHKRVYVQPANTPQGKGVSDWVNEDGTAKLIPIEFRHGKASVEDNLGRYMIDHGFAQASALILPPGAGLRG